MTKILITGVNGQVGFELQRALSVLGEIIAIDKDDIDLTNHTLVEQFLDKHQPDVIVNPAAFTAVDMAENESELAYKLNVDVPKQLATWANTHQALIVHYSTDYIFDGEKASPYVEEDAANPLSVYGQTKWQGEEATRQHAERHFILRTSWVVGSHGHNFLKTIFNLAKAREQLQIVSDQVGAPTSAALVADVTAHIIKAYLNQPNSPYFGTYHLNATGMTNWHAYAKFVLQLAEREGIRLKCGSNAVVAIKTEQYPLPAKRPKNSLLNCDKLQKTFGLNMPTWQEGVRLVFNQLKDTL